MAVSGRRGFRSEYALCAIITLLTQAVVQQSEAAIHRRQAGDPSAFDCVRDDNDQSDIISYGFSEEAPAGHRIGTLPIRGVADGPDQTIILTIEPSQDSAYVMLNMSEKTLILSQHVDPDIPTLQSRLNLDIKCSLLSLPDLQFEYRINIDVDNINDNAPEFTNLPYQANISELTLVDTVVFANIEAVDKDGQNAFGQLIYSVEYNPNDPEASDYFTFKHGGKGEIWLLRPLDYESKTTWEILIKARDNALEPRFNTTTVTLSILDGEDQPPRFLPCNATADHQCPPVTYSAVILEKENITDALVFEPGPIQAEDRDMDVATQGPITYSLVDGSPQEYVDYFRIDSVTGEVFLLQPINRADFREFSLEVKASESEAEGGVYAITQVSVVIQEVNEHRPAFDQSSYRGYIYENSPIGSQVSGSASSMVPLELHASDKDVEPGRSLMLTYFLSDATAHFILEGSPDGSFAYVVVSSNRLDREVLDHYTIMALAIENDTTHLLESNSTTIDVTILDVNDNPPYFLPNDHSIGDNRYRATVAENAETGSVIMTLETGDLDLPPHERVDFVVNYINNEGHAKIGPAQAGPGSVNIILKENGTIVDGEQYSISLQAVDGGLSRLISEVVYVEIIVLPANVSHAPTFEQRVYQASAVESLPIDSFITTVTAIDRDLDEVFYNITDGNDDGIFEVDSASGAVKIVGMLDREEVESYVLRIQATDGTHKDTCSLRITILDVNDNNPVFNTTLPTDFLVVEGMEDQFVGQVMAYDIDEPDTPNSIVRYSLESEAFRVEPDTGRIYAVGALDREEVARYELDVVAADTADSPRTETLRVVVTVQDVNDNSPVFEPSRYSVDIAENRLVQDFLTLQALDRDASAVLEYHITSGDTMVFSLAPGSGSLSLLTELDYEQAQTHTVQVTVRDTELAGGTNATATVTINVLDENDNEPVFTLDSYQGAVLRTADLGSIAASGIMARDGDMASTANGQVFYNIMPDSVYFTISNPKVGTVVTKTSLQNAPDVNNLTVVAYDNGDPSRSQTVPLTIFVRIERPVFPQGVYMVDDLREGEPAGTKVVELQASSNPGDLIEYQILSGDPNGNFEMVSRDNMGVMSTAKVLDRESVSTYSLMVQATVVETSTAAGGGGRRRRQAVSDVNVVEVVIDLVDVNDNVPWFEQSAYFVGVSDSAGVGTTVFKMKAYDMDSNNNSLIEYSMADQDASDADAADGTDQATPDSLFIIGASTGIIRTVTKFETEPRIFRRTVFGREQFGPPENVANATLTISLINEENRVVLVTNISPQRIRDHQAAVESSLEALLGGEVEIVVEDVGVRKHGDNLEKDDPSGSDTQFYVIDTETGEPFTSDELLELLQDVGALDAVLRDISQDGEGEVIEVRKPRTGKRPLTSDAEPTVEAVALLCLAVALFVLCILAIGVVIVSWKKREMEREKQARLYLPVYNTFNPYTNAEDHEIANPVYFDEHSVQVYPMSATRKFRTTFMPGAGLHRRREEDDSDLLFQDGAPSFMKPRETQEHTMDFDNELSSDDVTDEATMAANTIAAAVRSNSRKSSLKSRSKTPPSSGPPSYSSNGKLGRADSLSPSAKIHEISTIPYRRGGGHKTGVASPGPLPRQPVRSPPLFDPRPTPTSDPRSPFQTGSFDNYGAELDDEGATPIGSPISGARTDSSLSAHKLDY